ncbi:hypothetical protein HMPREF9455_03729 [Dysgonomonas gadei ATCC BAA-286]|uniref:Uncharacterized protein n=1 Tax=Dysgonomonas gadei ATCC BAA-286 TaxID=742766 RepID=F5J312_9BACT|nr:hypothetical protein HMPREF9455_03729 [Dysgonomonas gadei ATCC BAA-286]
MFWILVAQQHQTRQNHQQHRQTDDKSTDDGHGKRLLHLRTQAETQGQWHQGEDGSDGGHQLGTDAKRDGIVDRFHHIASRFAVHSELMNGKNRIFGDDADNHNDARVATHIQRNSRYPKRQQTARNADHGHKQHDKRDFPFAEQNHQHREHQQNGEAENGYQFGERLLLLRKSSAIRNAVSLR